MRARLAMEFFAVFGFFWMLSTVLMYHKREVWGLRWVINRAFWNALAGAAITTLLVVLVVILGD